ncbi:MAG: hypothetical protein WC243_02310, partial [Patescibacteria group bacterium]
EVTLRRRKTPKGIAAEKLLRDAGFEFSIVEPERYNVPILSWGKRNYVGLPRIRRLVRGLCDK